MLARVELEAARPQQALEFADLSAELGVPSAELERAYRVGQAAVWEQWLELATAYAAQHDLPLVELIDGPSQTILGYVDHIMTSVTERYDSRVSEQQRTRRQLRRLLVRQLIDGTIDEATPELDHQLAYPLADTHVALLVHPREGGLQDADIAALRDAADARATLAVQHGPGSWVLWLGRPGGYDRARLARLRRAIAAGTAAVAAGEPAAGLAGLRRTHAQAIDTARVQLALGLTAHPCVWASEVRLEALLLATPDRAARFVDEELGRLAAQDTLACRLRETLLAWLSTNSHVSAAASLGVHENTIRNRIRQAEELLDAPLTLRRTELQVALRLERVLRAERAAAGD
jgi:sugar diacid utilization regulator